MPDLPILPETSQLLERVSPYNKVGIRVLSDSSKPSFTMLRIPVQFSDEIHRHPEVYQGSIQRDDTDESCCLCYLMVTPHGPKIIRFPLDLEERSRWGDEVTRNQASLRLRAQRSLLKISRNSNPAFDASATLYNVLLREQKMYEFLRMRWYPEGLDHTYNFEDLVVLLEDVDKTQMEELIAANS